MPSSPSPFSAAQVAREALAARLREIRLGSGLSGKALADGAGWHPSKTSRIEHGVQPVTPQDVRTWCGVCGAESEAEDLVAALTATDGLYTQWRRLQPGGGLKRLQQSYVPLYSRTRLFRSYQGHVVPGLLQTVDYAEALLRQIGGYYGFRDDPRAAAAARLERSAILRSNRRFTFVLEEAVLRYSIGGSQVMAGQLRYLLDVMGLPSVSLAIIPASLSERAMWPVEAFIVFDDSRAHVELLSARVTVTAPGELSAYLHAHEILAGMAVRGPAARDLIRAAVGEQ